MTLSKNRALSGLLAVIYIVAAAFGGGAKAAFAVGMFVVLPLGCIWFSEPMGGYVGPAWRGAITSPTHEGLTIQMEQTGAAMSHSDINPAWQDRPVRLVVSQPRSRSSRRRCRRIAPGYSMRNCRGMGRGCVKRPLALTPHFGGVVGLRGGRFNFNGFC